MKKWNNDWTVEFDVNEKMSTENARKHLIDWLDDDPFIEKEDAEVFIECCNFFELTTSLTDKMEKKSSYYTDEFVVLYWVTIQ